jgi:predicted ATPase
LKPVKITRLDIEGFRSLRKVSWHPGDLNVVIGPNGSGKSNLIQFLELISVSAQGRLGKYIQSLGGMDAIVWDGQAASIKFALDIQSYELNNDHYEMELEFNRLGNSYNINNELLTGLFNLNNTLKEKVIEYLSRTNQTAYIRDAVKNTTISVKESLVLRGESILSSAVSPFDDEMDISRTQDNLASITIYHDLRTDKDAPIRQATITRFEKRVESDGQNLISVLHTLYTGDRDFKADINSAMKAAFGDDFEELIFPPASDQRIQLRVRWKSLKREQSAADLSDGTLRFLFLLTVLASPDPPPVIAIDEPETGLHPSMFPIVAEFAQDASMRSQVIFTTHYPQFLDAFTNAHPTTTVALWENGETILRTLPKDELAYWLKEYSLGSLFRSGELEQMG